MNLSYLLGAQGIQLPDPMAISARRLALNEAERRQREGQLREQELVRAQQEQEALRQALPALLRGEPVADVVGRYQQAGPAIVKYARDEEKSRLEARKTQAETLDKESQAKMRMADKLGAEAAWLADHPNLNADMIGAWHKKVAGAGLQDVLTTVPFEAWTDPQQARQALKSSGMMFYELKDRVAHELTAKRDAETGRHNVATEGMTAAQRAEQERHNRRMEGISGGNLALAQQRFQREGAASAGGDKWKAYPERGIRVNEATGEVQQLMQDGKPLGPAKDAKQGIASQRALEVIALAEPLIDRATSSMLGAGRDIALGAVGASTKEGDAAQQLKALEGALMLNQPRMEGPQSNLDVQLYKQMAGQIGDPTIPAARKKAALQMIKQLHEKYAEGAAPAAAPAAPNIDALLNKYAPR